MKSKGTIVIDKKQRKKRIIEFIIVAILVTVGFWWVLPKSRVLEASNLFEVAKVEAKAKEVVRFLDEGDYEALKAMSVKEFAQMINGEQMDVARKNLSEDWGELVSYDFKPFLESVQSGKHSAIAQVTVTYEHAKVTYMISFNETMKLNGLQMKGE